MRLAKKSDVENIKGKLEDRETSRKFEIELPKTDNVQKLVKYDKDGPYIDDLLFWFIVERCKPVRLQVARVFLKIFLATLAIVQAAKIIQDIDAVGTFPDIAYTISTLIAVWVIPHLVNASLNSLEKQDDQRLKKDVKQNIQIFREREKLQDKALEDEHKRKLSDHKKVWETIIEFILFAVFVTFGLLSILLDDKKRLVWKNVVKTLVTPVVGIVLVVLICAIKLHKPKTNFKKILKKLLILTIYIVVIILIVLVSIQEDMGLYCMVNVITVGFAVAIGSRIVVSEIYPTFESENWPESTTENTSKNTTKDHKNPSKENTKENASEETAKLLSGISRSYNSTSELEIGLYPI